MSDIDITLHEKILLKSDERPSNYFIQKKKAPQITELEEAMWLEVFAQDQVYIDSCGSKRTYHSKS